MWVRHHGRTLPDGMKNNELNSSTNWLHSLDSFFWLSLTNVVVFLWQCAQLVIPPTNGQVVEWRVGERRVLMKVDLLIGRLFSFWLRKDNWRWRMMAVVENFSGQINSVARFFFNLKFIKLIFLFQWKFDEKSI